MQEHRLTVSRTARYVTLGPTDGSARDVWLVCHGYGQLAPRFIRHFASLDNGVQRLVVAPEGLSRFYVDGGKGAPGKVGASWMTAECRLEEIEDYLNYLDTVCQPLVGTRDRGTVRFTALGFSQGVATVARWAMRTRFSPDRLILWAGVLPPELDLQNRPSPLQDIEIITVAGDADSLMPSTALVDHESRLVQSGLKHRKLTFSGGHELNVDTLLQLAKY